MRRLETTWCGIRWAIVIREVETRRVGVLGVSVLKVYVLGKSRKHRNLSKLSSSKSLHLSYPQNWLASADSLPRKDSRGVGPKYRFNFLKTQQVLATANCELDGFKQKIQVAVYLVSRRSNAAPWPTACARLQSGRMLFKIDPLQ